MRHVRLFSYFVMPILAAASLVTAALGRAVDFAREALDLFKADPPHLATAGYGMQLSIGGTALDPGTLNSLRHEAGVPRYSAARNT